MRADQNNPMSGDHVNPLTGKHRRAVGVFPNRQAAEHALHELRDSGFAMDRVSVVAQDADRRDEIAGADVSNRVGNKADDGAKVGAISGGALGGITGLLVGLGTLAIPGIGPVLLAGAGATALATTVAGGAIGAVAGGLVGGLIGLGIPEERARVYSDRVSRGDYLVMIEGTDAEIAQAEAILHRRGIEDYGVYDAPDRSTGSVHANPLPTTHSSHATAHTPATGTVPVGTNLGATQQAVGFFSNMRDVEGAVNELTTAGLPLRQISVVAQNVQRRGVLTDLDVHNRIEGDRFRLPNERTSFLQNRIDRGDYLLMVEGTEAEVQRAAAILNKGSVHRPGIQEFHIYDTSNWGRAHETQPQMQPQAGRSVTPGMAAGRPGQTLMDPARAHRRAVGAFEHHRDAEAALTELKNSGFSMGQVSLIAKDADRQGDRANLGNVQANTKADEGAKAGAATGGALGGLGGLLVGLGALAIPGVGPVIAGGAAATALATALTGGAIGAAAGGVTGGLVGVGIPEDRARVYNDRFNRGEYLVMVDGSETELHLAEEILRRRGIRDWGVFDGSDINATHSTGTARVDNPAYPASRSPDVVIDDRRRDLR